MIIYLEYLLIASRISCRTILFNEGGSVRDLQHKLVRRLRLMPEKEVEDIRALRKVG